MSPMPMTFETVSATPMDQVETYLLGKSWTFERRGALEACAEAPGYWCDYVLSFFWSEETDALQLSCALDMRVPAHRHGQVCELLALLNERLWIGHFGLWSETSMPVFRHTVLLADGAVCPYSLEDLVDIAMAECERFYPAFQFAVLGGSSAHDALDAALLDTRGEA